MLLRLSVLGWVHTLACLVALALGTANLLRRKATRSHRWIGQAYLWSILLAGVTSLGIYRLHRFFFPHWLAIATIVLATAAYAFARFRRPRRYWLRGHIVSTVLTFYLLIGGGVNEAFLRITVLRRLSGGFPSPLTAAVQDVLLGLTALVLIWFNVKYRGGRLRWIHGDRLPPRGRNDMMAAGEPAET